MKKIVFVCLLSFFVSACFAQNFSTLVTFNSRKNNPKGDSVYIVNKKTNVNWSNFLGMPNFNVTPVAITSSGFGYTGGMNYKDGVGILKLDVYCYFLKSESWVKPKGKNAYILKHEQNHVNISFYAAQLFKKKLQAAAFSKENYRTLLKAIYQECLVVMNQMQADYDGQTNNGLLKTEQAIWDKKLKELLATL